MRTATVTIAGREYPVCYSTGVVCACEEEFGSAAAVFNKFSAPEVGEKLRALVWLTAQMLKAGERYAQLTGQTTDKPPTEEQLCDLIGLDDVVELQTSLMQAVIGDASRNVEAVPPKNA